MYKLVTPAAAPVLTPMALFEQTWLRSTRRFFVPMFELVISLGWGQFRPQGHHIKLSRGSLGDATYQISNILLPVSEKKIFEVLLLCSYFPTCAPRLGPVLTLGTLFERIWQRSIRRCYIPNVKALYHPVSDKKNFEVFHLCSYVQTWDPRGGASFDPRGII